jgi:hypothetical protein
MSKFAKDLGAYSHARSVATEKLGCDVFSYRELQDVAGVAITRISIGHLIPPPDHLDTGGKWAFYKRETANKIMLVMLEDVSRRVLAATKTPQKYPFTSVNPN